MNCKQIVFLVVLSLTISKITAVIVNCNYQVKTWSNLPNALFTCEVSNPDEFSGENVQVTKVREDPDEVVHAFYSTESPNLENFPVNLQIFFPKLIAIVIEKCKISQISKNDLTHFPQLKYLYMSWNQIKFLRANTFVNNPNLEIVHFLRNSITHIDRNTFSHLKNLKRLELTNYGCNTLGDGTTKEEIKEIINKIENGMCNNNQIAQGLDDCGNILKFALMHKNNEIKALKSIIETIKNVIQNERFEK